MAAMMAVGVASTSAQGQKTTSIVTARIISPVKAQVSAAAESAITTIQVAQRSARPTIFAFPASALCTRRIIRCMELSSPTRVARISKEPKRFTVPELTSSPADLSTGRLSPVMTLWSTEVSPEMTTPSHRYRLAGQDAEYVALAHVPGGDNLLAGGRDAPRRNGREPHKPLYARPRPRDGHILEQRAELHYKRHLSGREILARRNGGDKRERNEHVRLYVEDGDEPHDGLEYYRHAAEDYRGPGRVKGQEIKAGQAQKQRGTAYDKEGYLPLHPAPFRGGLERRGELITRFSHVLSTSYTYRGMGI